METVTLTPQLVVHNQSIGVANLVGPDVSFSESILILHQLYLVVRIFSE